MVYYFAMPDVREKPAKFPVMVTKSDIYHIKKAAKSLDMRVSAWVRVRLGLPPRTRGRPPRPKPAKAKRPTP